MGKIKSAKKNMKAQGQKKNTPASAPQKEEVEEQPSFQRKKLFSDQEFNVQTTGVLAVKPDAKDIKIENFSLTFHGKELIKDTVLELNYGRRYGLIGQNGSGKSTLLKALANNEYPLPSTTDVYLLHEEAQPSEKTALEVVVEEVKAEFEVLQKEEEQLLIQNPDDPRLQSIYERMDEMDINNCEPRAAELLHGLGFSKEFMKKSTKDLSGGWRMRVALARALFVRPSLLLLDEPTNHLDLETVVWLEDYLRTYPHILLMISHSQDFLNAVCTDTINFRLGVLNYYGGNYDTYVKTREELETNQMKQFKKQQDDIAHIKKFVASCGTYSNLVKQGKSKLKIIEKMEEKGLVEEVTKDKVFEFFFYDQDKLPPPVLAFDSVSFAYSGKKEDELYRDVSFGIDCDSRVCLVGKNGTGKSTLVKLMAGVLEPTSGIINRHNGLRIGRYHQHSGDILNLEETALEFIPKMFPNMHVNEKDLWRSTIGRFGLSGSAQLCPMKQLSDGQKTRVVFMILVLKEPHILLLDEPTNHLDIEAIDSLAEAINNFQGGLVLVSHDFRLIHQVADEIWVCADKSIQKFEGSIDDYKKILVKEMKDDKKSWKYEE